MSELPPNSPLPPSPEPAPVQVLPYSTPTNRLRPGLLTAVGIVSIIVAAISGLASCGGVASAVMWVMMSTFGGAGMGISQVSVTSTVTTGPVATTTTTTTMPAFTPFSMSPVVSILSGGESLLSVAAAVVLLIAGIQLLRAKPSSRRLHWYFVFAKIPLVLLAAVATWMTYRAMWSSLGTMTTPGAPMPGAAWLTVLPVLFSAAVALAYPVALIVVLSSKLSRAYFESLGSEVA